MCIQLINHISIFTHYLLLIQTFIHFLGCLLMPKASAKKTVVEETNDHEDEVFDVECIKGHKIASVIDGKSIYDYLKYIVKWVGYSDHHNTAEPPENLSCPGKLREYWRKWVPRKNAHTLELNEWRKYVQRRKSTSRTVSTSKRKCISSESVDSTTFLKDDFISYSSISGSSSVENCNEWQIMEGDFVVSDSAVEEADFPVNHDLILESILGATNEFDGVHYLIKWKHKHDAELLSAEECERLFPDELIAFLESKLSKS